MLLKMATIEESLDNYEKSIYYLELFQKNKNESKVLDKINNIECIGTHNISYIKDDTIHCQLQKPLISTTDLSTQLYSGKYLHHIITNKGYFYLNDTMIKDYYYGMEQFFI